MKSIFCASPPAPASSGCFTISANATRHQKPGLACHLLAARFAAAVGLGRYELLAGDDRYKTSLAGAGTRLHWLEVGPRRSIAALLRHLAGPFWPAR